ncbi:peptide deformylase [Paenibacillus validus]|uniref:Peptide deformylase n=1 Tax=Paenibacillus validus TaxID=44253 RepID=A0A7X2ZF22_9BACL|nr:MULTISPECIES: peptide deformylase [Paenibacillus]MED4604116.1 peptide deformylase [Paenibacillus validus]MED4609747.1 peptide deformylase [Paenibacillus validus]MUG73701.1 peptide deformylase [Paenibacillus validus]
MAIKIIVKDPDPVLREKSKPVPKITPNIHKLLDDMADTMYDAEGVGLAAPQIGILKRVIVMDVGDEHGLIELINPEIIEKDGEQFGPEGCLSIPGLRGDVRRAERVKVKGLNRNGEEIVIEGRELLARCIQHEVDHLDGILYTDLAESMYRTPEDSEQDEA